MWVIEFEVMLKEKMEKKFNVMYVCELEVELN